MPFFFLFFNFRTGAIYRKRQEVYRVMHLTMDCLQLLKPFLHFCCKFQIFALHTLEFLLSFKIFVSSHPLYHRYKNRIEVSNKVLMLRDNFIHHKWIAPPTVLYQKCAYTSNINWKKQQMRNRILELAHYHLFSTLMNKDFNLKYDKFWVTWFTKALEPV